MKHIIIIVFLFFLVSFSIQRDNISTKESRPVYDNLLTRNWADSILNNLSIEQKIAQLFMVAANGKNLNENYYKKVDTLVTDYHIGGVIFFQSGPSELMSLINRYNQNASIPLLAGIDAEWGVSMRLDSAEVFPWMMTLGAIQNDSLVYNFGVHVAKELKKLGLHINFAPVLDINNNPNNPIIDRRSFGESINVVAKRGLAYMKGLQDNNILACGKHFPGHGDTDIDSHLALPVINHNRLRLDSLELRPYQELIQQGLGSIMVAHIALPQIDTFDLPASLSPEVIMGILKKDMGFKGLVISDALNMKALSFYQEPGERELQAFLAGNDILLFPNDVPEAIELIKSKISLNPVLENQLNHSCRQVLMVKKWTHLSTISNSAKRISEDSTEVCVNCNLNLQSDSSRFINRMLAKNAITLLRNNDVIPIQATDSLRIACVSMGSDSGQVFYNRLNDYMPVSHYTYNSELDVTDELVEKLSNYDLVIVGYHFYNGNFWTKHVVTKRESFFLDKLTKNTSVFLTIFGHPRVLNDLNLNDLDGVLLSYQNSQDFQDLSAQLIFGSIDALGRLPLSLNQFKIGDGLWLKKSRNFKFSLPIEVGLDVDSLNQIDTIVQAAISRHIMPGCQIVISRHGHVVYNKSFGHHTYDSLELVKNDHLYDIASITKIAAAAPIFMYLSDKKNININRKLKHYSSLFRHTNKANLRIIDILTHQSKLFPWIPFYKTMLNPVESNKSSDAGLAQVEYRNFIFSQTYSQTYPLQVAKDLYLKSSYVDTIFNQILDSDLLDTKEYRYSDLGFYLMMHIIQNKISSSIPDFLNHNFYFPLDAFRITYNPLDRFPLHFIVPTENDYYFRQQLIRGYVHDQGAALLGGIALHAGLFSNALDLAKLMQLYLDKGTLGENQLLSKKVISKFTKAPFADDGNRRGIVFDKPSIDVDENGPTCDSISLQSFGHSGWTGTMTWADPETGIVYVFLSNGRAFPDGNNTKLITENIRTDIQKIIYNSIID